MKRFLVLIMVVALLVSSMVLPASAEDVVELSFWHSMSGVNGTTLEGLVQEFNDTVGKENGIHVTPVFQGIYEDAMTKLRAIYASEDLSLLPEAFQVSAGDLGYMITLDEVITFDELTAINPDLKKEDLEPKTLAAFAYQGIQYAAPFACSTVLLYYNKDHLEEVGYGRDQAPETLGQVAEYCAKLYKEDENGNPIRYGFGCEMETWFLNSWIGMQPSTYGGDYSFIVNNGNGYDGLADKALFKEDGTMKNLLSAWKNMYDVGKFEYIVGSASEEFASGSLTMYVASSAALRKVLNNVGDKFEVGTAYMPKVTDADKGGVACGGSGLYALKNGSGHEKETALFIQFMTSPETQYKWATASGYFPCNVKSYELEEMKAFLAENPLFGIAVQQLHDSNVMVKEVCTAYSVPMDILLDEVFIALIEGEYTVDEAVDYLEEEFNNILSQAF